MVKKHKKLNDLVDVVKRLRNPKNGCPWDIQQTSKSLAKYTLEEAYEVIDCLLYTSPSPRDATLSRMPSSA